MKNSPSMLSARRLFGATLLATAGVPVGATAQPVPAEAPDARQIIEALRPSPPATRSMRNLIVREKAGADAVAAPAEPASAAPSISLAIQFDFDSARLRPQGEAALDQLSAALLSPELMASRFLVEGHTDAQGAAAYNLRLSRSRANEVRRYLLAKGVTAARVDTAGRGAQDPADPTQPRAAQNRRVRIVNIDAAGAAQ